MIARAGYPIWNALPQPYSVQTRTQTGDVCSTSPRIADITIMCSITAGKSDYSMTVSWVSTGGTCIYTVMVYSLAICAPRKKFKQVTLIKSMKLKGDTPSMISPSYY